MDDNAENIIPDKQAENRNTDGRFVKGVSGNPSGRPKGKTMKEFAREFLMSMTDEMKLEFLNSLSKDIVWRMAEGNPHNTDEIKGEVKVIPIYGGHSLPRHNSNSQDILSDKENTGSIGGNSSQ